MKLKYIPFKEKHDLHSDLLVCLKQQYDMAKKPVLSDDDLGYLTGLKHAKVQGIEDLIVAIKKHGKVQIFTE